MADGSIRINTKLETKEAQADLVKFEKECEKTAQKIGAAGEKIKSVFTDMTPAQLSSAFKAANRELQKTESALAKIEAQIAEVQAQTDEMLPYAATDEQAANLLAMEEQQLGAILQKRDELTAKAAGYKQQMAGVNAELERQKNKTKGADKEMQRLGTTMKRTFSQGFKRIARMTIGLFGMRSAFMALRRAASTFLEANADLKNQVDGLWNVLAVAIGPVIEKLVNWLSIAISYVNAFVKALWGVDLVAKANAMAMKKQAKATTDAAKASRQLAGFDEMNKLSDNSASAGGGGETPGMFKEVPVNTGFIDDFISKLNIILPIVMAIAGGIAAWKIARFFGADLKNAAGWALIIAGTVAAIYGFCDALINCLDWGNLLTMIIGIGVAVGGLAIVFGLTGVKIGLIVGGLMLVIAGFKDWLENGKSLEALAAITAGILAVGGALALIFGWPALIVAAVAALVVAVVMYWDEICAALKVAWNWICNLFSKLGDWMNKNVIQPVANFFVGLWNSIKNTFSAVGSFFTSVFTGAWNGIKKAFSAVGSFFSGVWATIKNMFSTIGTTIGNAIGSAFKNVVNSIIRFAENTINGFIKAINLAIGLINKIPGVNITKLQLLSIPKLAKGGIVNNPGRGVPVIAGEAGAEAVLPLENNTGWMDILAEKINAGAQKLVVPIYLNGRKIAEEVIDITNKRKFATNGAW